MSHYQLQKGLFILPTPYGAYHTVSTSRNSPEKKFLLKLLSQWRTPELTISNIVDLTGLDEEPALDLFYQCQESQLLQGLNEVQIFPDKPLEETLPAHLDKLSISKKAMLADNHGFYLANIGFEHDTAEELAALSADIAMMHEKHERALQTFVGEESSAWAMVDAMGNSRIGFWPLYLKEHRFVLVLSGNSRLNQPALTTLIQSLCLRYM